MILLDHDEPCFVDIPTLVCHTPPPLPSTFSPLDGRVVVVMVQDSPLMVVLVASQSVLLYICTVCIYTVQYFTFNILYIYNSSQYNFQ